MQNILQIIWTIFIAIMGIIMAVSPKYVTKESLQTRGRLLLIRILGTFGKICVGFALILFFFVVQE